jgi:hypothetical protein
MMTSRSEERMSAGSSANFVFSRHVRLPIPSTNIFRCTVGLNRGISPQPDSYSSVKEFLGDWVSSKRRRTLRPG